MAARFHCQPGGGALLRVLLYLHAQFLQCALVLLVSRFCALMGQLLGS